jgi:hypothetical protein
MIVNDTAATAASSLTVNVDAYGGAGGTAGSFGTDGAGGAASANGTVTGLNSVTLYGYAGGGAGGDGTTAGALGGTATTNITATGSSVTVGALSIGGQGAPGGGTATATATGNGASGTVGAAAGTTQNPGSHVFQAGASANTDVAGTATAKALALINTQNGLTNATVNAVALVDGAPDSTVTGAVLAFNPKTAAALGIPSSPTFFALAELGGKHSSTGTDVQTSDSAINFQVALTTKDDLSSLKMGLVLGSNTGTGVSNVTLDISANGTDLYTKSFTSGAAATAFFTDNPINLGFINNPLYANGTMDLRAELTVTSTGGGFWGSLLFSG